MENQKQQIAESIKQANNVLVTVSNNPNVDQLAAAIGFALLLNKLNKHGAAVFSGTIPSTLGFLKPEKTIEKNTDSLRDFIIALDKSKADKLRYKVEDEHVKIFITPYRTSINQLDLQFSQGDFNVDVVVALGVHEQKDLDQAITAHGRILHDATVISINNKPGPNLGSLNWLNEKASSLSEMMSELAEMVHDKPFDGQMATAFLTGIVAETERFSNEKTGAATMAVSGKLIAAGANQQLVAEQLEPHAAAAPIAAEPSIAMPYQPENDAPPVGSSDPNEKPKEDGSLLIDHTPEPAEPAQEEPKDPDLGQIHIDESGEMSPLGDVSAFVTNGPIDPSQQQAIDAQTPPEEQPTSNMILEPPTMGGAASAVMGTGGNADEMALPAVSESSFLAENASDNQPPAPEEQPQEAAPPQPVLPPEPVEPIAPQLPPMPPAPAEPAVEQPQYDAGQTLNQIEETVDSAHLQPPPTVVAPQSVMNEDPAAEPVVGEHRDYGVQGHKRIEPIPHEEPHLSLPPDPILGDTSVVGAAPTDMMAPPPAAPPMMPGLPPVPGMSVAQPVSGQVFPPQQ